MPVLAHSGLGSESVSSASTPAAGGVSGFLGAGGFYTTSETQRVGNTPEDRTKASTDVQAMADMMLSERKGAIVLTGNRAFLCLLVSLNRRGIQ